MKETCFYCYYHSRCSRFGSSEFPVCENWKPAQLPERAIMALYADFLKQSNALLAHVYNDNQRIAMMNYLVNKGDMLQYAFNCYKSAEMPLGAPGNNAQYSNMQKR